MNEDEHPNEQPEQPDQEAAPSVLDKAKAAAKTLIEVANFENKSDQEREAIEAAKNDLLTHAQTMLEAAEKNPASAEAVEFLEAAAAIIEAAKKAAAAMDQRYLPGLEPDTIRAAPPYPNNETTILPTAELFRNIHELEAHFNKDGSITTRAGIDPVPHKYFVYMKMLDDLGKEYPITAQDKCILLALGNLYEERQKQPGGKGGLYNGSIVTPEDIIRRYRGLDASDRVDPDEVQQVISRVYWLMSFNVSFDFTQHFEYRRKVLGDKEEVIWDIPQDMRNIDSKTGLPLEFSYRGKMVWGAEIKVRYPSGRVDIAWELIKPPIVYQYARKVKQFAIIQTKLLDLREKARSSRDADVMKVYLLERITAMLDPRTHRPKPGCSHIISLENMFYHLQIQVNNREAKARKVKIAKAILDVFQETPDKTRGMFIQGYKEITGLRGAVTGFEIVFTESKDNDSQE